ncbi:hypothetical protein HPB51_019070 [Rhipicephalus microplus]|uniref:DUF7041 domain-containing protein n=1 Tax=Rhipicephalus microplus TaxID=6941 RepID=A0A9J6D6P4_RHIMP|nr:hypothetical protein HPB51_019070 [Rhipicephalus microplus]
MQSGKSYLYTFGDLELEQQVLRPSKILYIWSRPCKNNNEVETQFTTGIVPQETKFRHVILALTLTEIAEVFNIILAPPAEQPHDALKRELIRRTTLTEQKRLQQL